MSTHTNAAKMWVAGQPLTFTQKVTFADAGATTVATALPLEDDDGNEVELLANTMVRASGRGITQFNAGVSDAVTVGDGTTADKYLADADIAVDAGTTFHAGDAYVEETAGVVPTVTYTSTYAAGAAATAGEVHIMWELTYLGPDEDDA